MIQHTYIKNKVTYMNLKNILANQLPQPLCLRPKKQPLCLRPKKQPHNKNTLYQLPNLIGGDRHRTFSLTVSEPWFGHIKANRKTIEDRLNRGVFKRIKAGDTIIWKNKNLKIKTLVRFIKVYDNFKEMLVDQGIDSVLPGVTTFQEGHAVYMRYFSKQQEEENGVVAIGLKLISDENAEQDSNGQSSDNSSSDNSSSDNSSSDNQNCWEKIPDPEFKAQVFEGKLQSPYYDAIRDGIKIYEVRVNDEKRKKMKVGDYWNFRHNDDPDLPIIRTRIIEIKLYDSFADAIQNTGYAKLLPQVGSINEAIITYENFDNGNYKRDAEKYGVIRFKLCVEPN
jgi:ASC-1-like (ASCH) protein